VTNAEYTELVVILMGQLSVFMLVGGLLLGAGFWVARSALDGVIVCVQAVIASYRRRQPADPGPLGRPRDVAL
jgi:hypothetical protein